MKPISISKPNLNESVMGIFGQFKSGDSFPVHFLMTNLTSQELSKLQVAADAFKFEQVNFEEMVQRDIDRRRVSDEIVEGYLCSSTNRALFFPPIIVAVVAFDESNNPVHKFEKTSIERHERDGYPVFSMAWDNYYSMELPIEDGSGYKFTVDDHNVSINKYFSKIRYDSSRVKLIVIDGQHRFAAINELAEKDPSRVKSIDLPVCICFSPNALEMHSCEDVLETLRAMFVTINNTGKQVGGHFLDLLNDHSLASILVRKLSNKWKASSEDGLRSSLQFIEWNQRESSKSNQVNKKQSVTTVSMLCECLRKTVFSKPGKKASKTCDLLYLKDIENDFPKIDEAINIYDIYDDNFSREQREVLEKQIERYLVPAIDSLLSLPSVYCDRRRVYIEACDYLENQIALGKDGWSELKRIFASFKEVDKKYNHESVLLAAKDFNLKMVYEDYLDNYNRLVFQYAYLKVWGDFSSHAISILGIDPNTSANIFVKICEKVVFNKKYDVFSKQKIYNDGLLYKNGKPNVTVAGRNYWSHLLYTCLLNRESLKELSVCVAEYENNDEFINKVISAAKENYEIFKTSTIDFLRKDFEKNWNTMDMPLSERKSIEPLFINNDSESLKKREDYILKKISNQNDERISILNNIVS